MIQKPIATALRIAALSAAWLLQAPAQAGLVSGSWDPAFGVALPGLTWGVHAEMLIPDNACANQTGNQTTTGDCAGSTLLGVFLRLYNTGEAAPDWTDPTTYTGAGSSATGVTFAVCDSSVATNAAFTSRCNGNFNSSYFDLQALRIENGSIAGLQSDVLATFETFVTGQGSWPSSAQGNDFTLGFTLNGPKLTCATCTGGPIVSDITGMRQFLVTYTSDDTSTPKFRDAAGNALGVQLDENGNVLGMSTSIDGALVNPVPEPGSLGLAAAALAAAALLRRRRR
jgi:hypothetical protein